MEALGVSSRGLLISLLAPLLCPGWSAVRSQNLNVVQSPETVSVAAGETLTLNCTLFGANLPGGVRWYKGSDPNRILIYTDKSASRGERALPGSNMDFTIRLRDIQSEDAGTYFCIKLRAGTQERVAASGKGTKVSVIARPVMPSLRGPKDRMMVGSVAIFNCTTEGFSPQEIEVIWSKDGRRIQKAQTEVLPEGQQGTSFRVESTVEVLLTRGDVQSRITCGIQHSTLAKPLEQEFQLSDILRVPPKVRLDTSPPSPVLLNNTVTVTCHVEEFYPDDASVELFTKNPSSEKGKVVSKTKNSDGTSSLKSCLEVTATEDRNSSLFTCQVQHDSQALVNTTTLFIRMQLEDNGGFEDEGPHLTILIVAVVVCALLVALVVAIIYLIHARHKKGKDSTSVRLHESEKSPGLTNQDPDPNSVAYADLNFDNNAKTPLRSVESPQQTTYANLQAVQPAANDDNVTYADLDMVHLSKAPKRPSLKAEEAGSEYASVQVQNK